MSEPREAPAFQVFSTSPQSRDVAPRDYLRQVTEVARWSEEAGCTGILVYTDNGIVDPWLVSQIIVQHTERLCPLVAVQPAYMHPYTVAKMVSSLAFLHGRRVYLNMVAGGFTNDLAAVGDQTPHDQRYERLFEYTTIVRQLVSSDAPVTCEGTFYRVARLKLTPPVPPELQPGLFMSGSSAAGLAAARQLGATAVQYPKPPSEYQDAPLEPGLDAGIRIGVIARATSEEAWAVARERFPEDRRGQLTHQLAMKVSDSVWHRQLSALADQTRDGRTPYWLVPFENYKTNCPYLVGSYDQVAAEVAGYLAAGHRSFILDIPPSRDELAHVNLVFASASALARRRDGQVA